MKRRVFFLGFGLTLLLVAASCGTTSRVSQDRYIYSSDTIYLDKTKIDSIYIRDSVYIHSKADTVWQYRDRYEYRYIYLQDTVYQSFHDTTTVETIKYIKEELRPFEKIKAKAFWFLVSCLLIVLLLLFGRKHFRSIFNA